MKKKFLLHTEAFLSLILKSLIVVFKAISAGVFVGMIGILTGLILDVMFLSELEFYFLMKSKAHLALLMALLTPIGMYGGVVFVELRPELENFLDRPRPRR